MLTVLFLTLLWAWLGLTLLTLAVCCLKNNKRLYLWRVPSIGLALLTSAVGLIGLITQRTVSETVRGLFFGFHPSLSMDSLSSFFVMLTGLSYLGISVFSVDYFRHFTQLQQKKIQCGEMLFVFSMILVFTANDPLMFLFAWEMMA